MCSSSKDWRCTEIQSHQKVFQGIWQEFIDIKLGGKQNIFLLTNNEILHQLIANLWFCFFSIPFLSNSMHLSPKRITGPWGKDSSWYAQFLSNPKEKITSSSYSSIWFLIFFFQAHCIGNPGLDFYKYMIRILEADYKQVVGIR